MRSIIKVRTNDFNFKFRVSGIVINKGKILLVDMDDSGFLCLPGGYVELGETTEEAIKREMEEEVLKKFTIKKYNGVVENYFINKYNKKMHEIAFYYTLEPSDKLDDKDFVLHENDNGYNIKLSFKWVNLKDIDNYDIRPSFLKDILKNKNLEFNHLIFNELD